MRVTRNPVCPQHPDLEVEVAYRPPAYERQGGVWVCSACSCPLGLAHVAGPGSMTELSRFPRGRRPKPSEPPWGAIDFGWCYPQPTMNARMDFFPDGR